ncbi:hypothetical protein [Amycolatopsis sulphurea]|uniref:hypothetical protein n=1 Tax=Amycolatopsis sulphurea TaxID=76022 RepID=UPI000BF36CF5|nr:hypothetical protein [Amycolatopsis sulphurea]
MELLGAMQAQLFTGMPVPGTAELVIMLTHHPEVTHFDSLVHQVLDGKVYPGVPYAEAGDLSGYRHGSTAVFGQGVLTRGVLVDLAADGPLPEGHGVTGEALRVSAKSVWRALRGCGGL